MNGIKERYETFEKMCVPPETPEHYKILVEHAFYGGALELINAMGEAKKGNDKEVANVLIKALFNEVIQFGLSYLENRLNQALGIKPKEDKDVQP